MKTIDYSYFIEKYISGEMNEAERLWFEKEIEGNTDLQKELHLRKRVDKILERQDIVTLRAKLENIERTREVKKSLYYTPGFRYAAVLTLFILVGGISYLSLRTESPSALFGKYYKSYGYIGSTRSAESASDASIENFNKAKESFNKGQYEKALIGFRAYLKDHPDSYESEFYSGLSYMEIKQLPEAESSFKSVIRSDLNIYIEDANWYLALCYLATEDKIKATEQLLKIVKSESIYKRSAKRILRHL